MRFFLFVLFAFGIEKSQAANPKLGAKTGPGYSKIVRVLPSQPVENARLLYWDQSVADALRIHTPPGRVGIATFEKAILNKIAREIKAGAAPLLNVIGNTDETGQPLIFVEDDNFHGSGRAGYIEVEPGVWVNIKGIGITGAGGTSALEPNPPSSIFVSHKDGSATLEEGIKETVYGRVADAELSRGGGRILAMVYTGRTLKYPDGKEVPLVEIVRGPLTRYDQPGSLNGEVSKALGEANAKRIFKGDFVNTSNMGAQGEFVDYGTMSFTEGYAAFHSSQDGEQFLQEGSKFAMTEVVADALGAGLIQQMGIPEAHLNLVAERSSDYKPILRDFVKAFKKATYWEKKYFGSNRPKILIDFKEIDQKTLQGNVRFQEFFKDAAKNYFAADVNHLEAIFKSEFARLLTLTSDSNQELLNRLTDFLKDTHKIFEQVAQMNRIQNRVEYGEKLGILASFKNRDGFDLVRPTLFNRAGGLSDQYVNHHDASDIGNYIENTVMGNRFSTAPATDNLILTSVDKNTTRLFVRAFGDEDGLRKLFAFPDLGGASIGEKFFFRVTTDGWKTQKDIQARFVTTKFGRYFSVSIPHGSMAVTGEQVEMVPFVQSKTGEIRWLSDHLNLKGPPILFNERLGLPASFKRKPGTMRTQFNTPISIMGEDLKQLRGPERCNFLMGG